MKQMEVQYLGELRTQGTHLKSGKELITDAPPDNNGKGEAYSPTDLVASALASCMITIMGIQANKNGWNITGVRADIEKIMAANPRRIAGIRILLHFPSTTPSNSEARNVLEQAAYSCPVALSLHPDLRQEIEFLYE